MSYFLKILQLAKKTKNKTDFNSHFPSRANISYHAHFGPVRMFLPLVPHVVSPVVDNPSVPVRLPVGHNSHTPIQEEEPEPRPILRKQVSDGHLLSGTGPPSPKLSKRYSSPILGHRRSREVRYSGDSVSVFGLYGDLLNVREYYCDSTELGRKGNQVKSSLLV